MGAHLVVHTVCPPHHPMVKLLPFFGFNKITGPLPYRAFGYGLPFCGGWRPN